MVLCQNNPLWAGSLHPPLCSARGCWCPGILCGLLDFHRHGAVDHRDIMPVVLPALLRRKIMESMGMNHIDCRASANPPSKIFHFRP